MMHRETRTRVDALERLDGARDERERCAERRDAALGPSGELSAQVKLQAAEEQYAARDAWVRWTERDC